MRGPDAGAGAGAVGAGAAVGGAGFGDSCVQPAAKSSAAPRAAARAERKSAVMGGDDTARVRGQISIFSRLSPRENRDLTPRPAIDRPARCPLLYDSALRDSLCI